MLSEASARRKRCMSGLRRSDANQQPCAIAGAEDPGAREHSPSQARDLGLAIVEPTLLDILTVCHRLPQDQRRQWTALHDGQHYDADRAAAHIVAVPRPRWALVKARGKAAEALAIGGFTYLRPRVWQGWLLSTEETWSAYRFTATRLCRRVLDQMMATEGHRLQCSALAELVQVHAFCRAVGCQHESTLRRFGAGGEDAVMYARVN